MKFLTKGDMPKVEDQIIEKIDSDTKIVFKNPGAKAFDSEVSYQYKIMPKVDQTSVFKNVE